MRDSAFDALIQWCLIFDNPLSQIDLVDSTKCTLHGMIVWQNLNSLLGEDVTDAQRIEELLTFDLNQKSSVIHGGISCTLGELRKGKVKARLSLEFSPESKAKNVVRDFVWDNGTKTPLKAWLKTMQHQIRDKKRADSEIVCLTGIAPKSGYLCDRSLKYKSAIAAARGVSVNEVPMAYVYQFLARELVDKKEYIGPGGSARVALYNDKDELVTSSTLTIH